MTFFNVFCYQLVPFPVLFYVAFQASNDFLKTHSRSCSLSVSLGDEMEDSVISTNEAGILESSAQGNQSQGELSHLIVWQVANV